MFATTNAKIMEVVHLSYIHATKFSAMSNNYMGLAKDCLGQWLLVKVNMRIKPRAQNIHHPNAFFVCSPDQLPISRTISQVMHILNRYIDAIVCISIFCPPITKVTQISHGNRSLTNLHRTIRG